MLKKQLSSTELILNPDGSVYHLGLKPNEIAKNIITVGDPDRVAKVSAKFDTIDFTKQVREFVTHTGTLQGKKITVISTGIGTDNIDIVLNELDALVNIDLENRTILEQHTALNIFRVGTSGALQKDIALDSILLSTAAVGFDGLMNFYWSSTQRKHQFTSALSEFLNEEIPTPYYATCSSFLLNHMNKNTAFIEGITLTMPGFYAPQGRTVRYNNPVKAMLEKLPKFTFNQSRLTNIEMETAGIYGLAQVLGHQAISVNAILANRLSNVFSTQAEKTINKTIDLTLEKILEL